MFFFGAYFFWVFGILRFLLNFPLMGLDPAAEPCGKWRFLFWDILCLFYSGNISIGSRNVDPHNLPTISWKVTDPQKNEFGFQKQSFSTWWMDYCTPRNGIISEGHSGCKNGCYKWGEIYNPLEVRLFHPSYLMIFRQFTGARNDNSTHNFLVTRPISNKDHGMLGCPWWLLHGL